MMNQQGKIEQWEERQNRDQDQFDWYQRWKDLKPIIKDSFELNSKILIVGCGTSKMSEEMAEEGYQSITNVDQSNNLIPRMQEKFQKYSNNVQYKVANVLYLSSSDYEEREFDVCIDKACMDSILCGENSTTNAKKALEEIYRVLKNDGVQILITQGAPESRRNYLESETLNWEILEQTIPKPTINNAPNITAQDKTNNVHQIQICKKRNLRVDFNEEEQNKQEEQVENNEENKE